MVVCMPLVLRVRDVIARCEYGFEGGSWLGACGSVDVVRLGGLRGGGSWVGLVHGWAQGIHALHCWRRSCEGVVIVFEGRMHCRLPVPGFVLVFG